MQDAFKKEEGSVYHTEPSFGVSYHHSIKEHTHSSNHILFISIFLANLIITHIVNTTQEMIEVIT